MNLELRFKEINDRLKEIRGLADSETDVTKLEELERESDALISERSAIEKKLSMAKKIKITDTLETKGANLEDKEARIINFRQSPIYNEFIQAATDESINMEATNNESKWKELEDAIDKTYPSFRNQLTLMCPHLSKKEMKVCLLTKVGISPSGIAIILKTSRQGITNIRSRIYKKIQDKGTEYSKINDFIENI